ncbi:hypothetical protein U5801_04320 [Lamprobacter modestohalophilus]|uniref:hypothetical protein n=1 Tax=Lamprobacter modestohalophilus TaxID=1064514 RepID=UPI002ADEA6C9|nr:hypothetical protein [Lamprobacter modestohalophilus]MEA1049036.1 hypothetical protein [Lamprobacter modestohalophilus]
MPAVFDALRLSLEGRFANRPVTELPAADVAVVLGGGIDSGPPSWPYPNLGEAADRVWHAARLYRAGKVEMLIRTTRSLVSAGTERMLVDFGKANPLEKARQQPDKVKQVKLREQRYLRERDKS